jgi:hypothetical protein
MLSVGLNAQLILATLVIPGTLKNVSSSRVLTHFQ